MARPREGSLCWERDCHLIQPRLFQMTAWEAAGNLGVIGGLPQREQRQQRTFFFVFEALGNDGLKWWEQDPRDGSPGRSTCCWQACWPGFGPWNPHGGREVPTPESCSLTSTHVPWHMCMQVYSKIKKCRETFKDWEHFPLLLTQDILCPGWEGYPCSTISKSTASGNYV